MMFNSMVLLRT